MCRCGGFGGGGGGGGTGNLSGNLTIHKIPVASGLHTLVDGIFEQASGDTVALLHGSLNTQADQGLTIIKNAAGSGPVGNSTYFETQRGTLAAPAALQDGDDIFALLGYGYNGVNLFQAGYIKIVVDGTPSAGNCPAAIELWTSDQAGDDPTLGLRQNPDGSAESNLPFTAKDEFTAEDVATFNDKIVINNRTQNRYEALAIVTGAVAVDASLSNWFDLAVGAAAAFAIPTNPIQGGVMQVRIRMGGAFAVTFSSASGGYRFVNDVAPTFDAADGTYYLFFEYNDLDTIWDCVGGPRGPFGAS